MDCKYYFRKEENFNKQKLDQKSLSLYWINSMTEE